MQIEEQDLKWDFERIVPRCGPYVSIEIECDNNDEKTKKMAKMAEGFFNRYLDSPEGQEFLENVMSECTHALLYGHPIDMSNKS